jgi:hypothetical protein
VLPVRPAVTSELQTISQAKPLASLIKPPIEHPAIVGDISYSLQQFAIRIDSR